MFTNKTILITGGTGTFGQNFTKFFLKNFKPKKIIIFSRDEMKQWNMSKNFSNDKLRFFIGDIRDKNRLDRALYKVDFVIHAAAQKIVPIAEYNPFECVKTNIIGGMNIVDAAIDNKVKKVVALSTDKASSPINLYGASKLVSDKIFVSGNNYSINNTKFSVVRYGNVMGSRGSVIPFFLSIKKDLEFPITHKEMTRFMISIDEGIKTVIDCFWLMNGGEIFIKKSPSMKILDIVKAINKNAKIKIIGIRDGEKIHEEMISQHESVSTFESSKYYVIDKTKKIKESRKLKFKKSRNDLVYASNINTDWMTIEYLKKWIEKNHSNFIY